MKLIYLLLTLAGTYFVCAGFYCIEGNIRTYSRRNNDRLPEVSCCCQLFSSVLVSIAFWLLILFDILVCFEIIYKIIVWQFDGRTFGKKYIYAAATCDYCGIRIIEVWRWHGGGSASGGVNLHGGEGRCEFCQKYICTRAKFCLLFGCCIHIHNVFFVCMHSLQVHRSLSCKENHCFSSLVRTWHGQSMDKATRAAFDLLSSEAKGERNSVSSLAP